MGLGTKRRQPSEGVGADEEKKAWMLTLTSEYDAILDTDITPSTSISTLP